MSTHTPGPWEILGETDDDNHILIVGPRDHNGSRPVIARVTKKWFGNPDIDGMLNAQFMATALDMWGIIQAIYEWAGEDSDQPLLFTPEWIETARQLFIRRMGGDPTSGGRTIAELKAEIDSLKKAYSRNVHWQGEALKHEELAHQLSDLVVDLEAVLIAAVGSETSADCHADHHGHCQTHHLQPIEDCYVKQAEEVLARVKKVRGDK